MAIKLADTLSPMADFPAVMAKDTNIVKPDGTEKSLQKMFEDGELGGGGSGLPLPESKNKLLITEEDEEGNLDWVQVDKDSLSIPVNLERRDW